MARMRAALFLFCSMITALPFAGGQIKECPLTLAQSPTLRSFRLGMTKREIARLHPKIGAKGHPWYDVEYTGYSQAVFEDRSAVEEYLPEIDITSISSIKLGLLDDRLAKLHVTYDGFTEWENVEQFLSAIITSLRLPATSHWRNTDSGSYQRRQLACGEFVVEVELLPKLSEDSLPQPSITIASTGLVAELENRESGRKEKQRKIFKP